MVSHRPGWRMLHPAHRGHGHLVMDPYVTSRSFSTPLGLFALAAAIDHNWTRSALFLLLAGLMHPLMTLYAAAFVLLFILIDQRHVRAALVLSLLGVITPGTIYLATLHDSVSPAYSQTVLSSVLYLFPSGGRASRISDSPFLFALRAFGVSALKIFPATLPHRLMLGTTAALAAFLFVHPSDRTCSSACNCCAASTFSMCSSYPSWRLRRRTSPESTTALYPSRGAAFTARRHHRVDVYFHRDRYPYSANVELPGEPPRNPWQQTFLWIRANTPRDAVFAANPQLVFLNGEDSQGFRATTGRSLLADDKDEGVAVVFPHLAADGRPSAMLRPNSTSSQTPSVLSACTP